MENNLIEIAPTLKKMGKDDTATFSVTQFGSLSSAIQRVQTESGYEKKFTQKTNKELKVIVVTREN